MNELHAWDVDGTMRHGSLLGDAVSYGIHEGFIDASHFGNPAAPTYEEVDYFVTAITQRSRRIFREVISKVADEAREQSFPWALEELALQARDAGHILVLSHSPDFLVEAYGRGMGVTRANGSLFEVTGDEIFSGHAVTLDKAVALEQYMREHQIHSLASAAGDSEGDLPMLERARHSTVVNPSGRLAQIAMHRHWHVIRTEAA